MIGSLQYALQALRRTSTSPMPIKLCDINDKFNCITHSGVFHADEVLGTVILEKAFGDISLLRAGRVPDGLSADIIVYDIGCGKYDHHQPGGNGARGNGVAYASAGLLWREFGKEVVKRSNDPDYLWQYIDEALIQGVDAADNGDSSLSGESCQVYSFSKIVSGFNPEWNDSKTHDEAFLDAVRFARTVFENVFAHGEALIMARPIVEAAMDRAKGHILILDSFVPWKEILLSTDNPKAKEIFFVVYPSERGGFCWYGVPESIESYRQRKCVPKEWLGLFGRELQNATGVETAVFCHQNGFTGSAETLQDACQMAKIACNC